MSMNNMTRRRFVAGSAGAAAVIAGAGIAATEAIQQADALAHIGDQVPIDHIYTYCDGCSNACGCTSYNVKGEFAQIMTEGTDSRAQGSLCARGFAVTQSAFSDDNITQPLKRLPSGRYDELGWELAILEIANKINKVVEESGEGSLGLIYSPNATTSFYAPYLMNAAFRCANVFVNDLSYNASKAAGFNQVIGASSYTPDIANANMVLLIDTSYADIERPNLVKEIRAAKEAGTPIVAIDSRYGSIASMADEWISVRPGTELALLLGVCNRMINKSRYDLNYVAANSTGFEQWADAISIYTPEWVSKVCGITTTELENLASLLETNAPRIAVEYGSADLGTGSFANSGETARVVCLLNTLLGAWNIEGGALLPFDWSNYTLNNYVSYANFGSTDGLESVFEANEYPLALSGNSMALAIERMKTHQIKCLIAVDSNIVSDYASTGIASALEDLELFVAITNQMNETAQVADYVLPNCSFLETTSLPKLLEGKTPTVNIQNQAIVNTKTSAWPTEEILSAIAITTGAISPAAIPSAEMLANTQLAAFGFSVDALKNGGTAAISDGAVARITNWRTPTGKIQFVSEACEDAGLSPFPIWVAPYSGFEMLADEELEIEEVGFSEEAEAELCLISGEQTCVGSQSANLARLMDIAKQYNLYRAWINSSVAEELGIEDGDEIVITSNCASDTVEAHVTDRINEYAVYLPRFFGVNASGQSEANGVGLNPMLFAVTSAEAGYGAVCNQGSEVLVKKAGA